MKVDNYTFETFFKVLRVHNCSIWIVQFRILEAYQANKVKVIFLEIAFLRCFCKMMQDAKICQWEFIFNKVNDNGESALHYGAKIKKMDLHFPQEDSMIIQLLMEHGSDVFMQTKIVSRLWTVFKRSRKDVWDLKQIQDDKTCQMSDFKSHLSFLEVLM